jgi:Ca2+-binding RTX toxin-like protein
MLVLATIYSSTAAANVIPITRLTHQSFEINANTLKPIECASIYLENITVGSGKFKGDKTNELLLGSPFDDNIRSGKKGDDCILGGAGDDIIDGNGATSICIGGPGNDTFKNCEVVIQ